MNLLLQPGAIEDGVNNIAQATRTLAPLELTQDVCRALQAGRDPVETFVQLNLAQRRKDYEREQELEARVKELEMDLTDTKRKLCEAELGKMSKTALDLEPYCGCGRVLKCVVG